MTPLSIEYVEPERRRLAGLSHRALVALYAASPGSPSSAVSTLLSSAVLIDLLIWRAASGKFGTKDAR